MPFWARLIFLASRPTLGMNRSRIVRKSDSLGLTLPIINAQTAWPLYISGFPVNISQGVCTALTMVLFGPALLEKLERVKLQYGMTEDGNGV